MVQSSNLYMITWQLSAIGTQLWEARSMYVYETSKSYSLRSNPKLEVFGKKKSDWDQGIFSFPRNEFSCGYWRSNQSILKEISPGISLEGMMLKLKLQYFGHLMRRVDSLEKTTLRMRWEGDDRGWDGWMASLTRWTWVSVNCGSWWWTGRPGVLRFMGLQRVRHDWATDLIWSDSHIKATMGNKGCQPGSETTRRQ